MIQMCYENIVYSSGFITEATIVLMCILETSIVRSLMDTRDNLATKSMPTTYDMHGGLWKTWVSVLLRKRDTIVLPAIPTKSFNTGWQVMLTQGDRKRQTMHWRPNG